MNKVKRKNTGWLHKNKTCLICEKPLTHIPVGQLWKVHNISPVFYHVKCGGN